MKYLLFIVLSAGFIKYSFCQNPTLEFAKKIDQKYYRVINGFNKVFHKTIVNHGEVLDFILHVERYTDHDGLGYRRKSAIRIGDYYYITELGTDDINGIGANDSNEYGYQIEILTVPGSNDEKEIYIQTGCISEIDGCDDHPLVIRFLKNSNFTVSNFYSCFQDCEVILFGNKAFKQIEELTSSYDLIKTKYNNKSFHKDFNEVTSRGEILLYHAGFEPAGLSHTFISYKREGPGFKKSKLLKKVNISQYDINRE